MKKILVEKDRYFDSVFLMLLTQDVKKLPGVADAVVAMATTMNRALLADLGYHDPALAGAGPGDLVIAMETDGRLPVDETVAEAKLLLNKKKPRATGPVPTASSLSAAVAATPDANLAVISVPGAYAAREARRALEFGLHVMLFSDNVGLEDEIELKRLGRDRGLLVMGPDCGTAIINGHPLCFANVVRRGPVGIVAASGTGLQEVSCAVDRAGSGISQAIGTGGRDLKNERVGGTTMLMGVEALGADPSTAVIAVVSKPPAPAVAERVVAALSATGKPGVIHFIGLPPRPPGGRVHFASNLEETGLWAAALAGNRGYTPRVFEAPDEEIAGIVERETGGMSQPQRYIRGLYTGGTLADEALLLLHGLTGAVYSNNQIDQGFLLPDPKTSIGHTVVDLGDDVFTVGRPHPMIDPATRTERLAAEAEDPEVAVLLFDLVLGFGSHDDPAAPLAEGIRAAKAAAASRGGYLAAVASVTGTPGDPQGLAAQADTLKSAGCVVMPSNYQASMLAVKIMERVGSR